VVGKCDGDGRQVKAGLIEVRESGDGDGDGDGGAVQCSGMDDKNVGSGNANNHKTVDEQVPPSLRLLKLELFEEGGEVVMVVLCKFGETVEQIPIGKRNGVKVVEISEQKEV